MGIYVLYNDYSLFVVLLFFKGWDKSFSRGIVNFNFIKNFALDLKDLYEIEEIEKPKQRTLIYIGTEPDKIYLFQ